MPHKSVALTAYVSDYDRDINGPGRRISAAGRHVEPRRRLAFACTCDLRHRPDVWRLEMVIRHGSGRTGDEHAIADLICDLGHLAEERGLNFLSEVSGWV